MDPTRLEMLQMATGYWISKMLYCAAKLRVADLLAKGPVNVAALAKSAGAHEESLFRLLRALASIGVFKETTPRTFELTRRPAQRASATLSRAGELPDERRGSPPLPDERRGAAGRARSQQ
jgi:hypothetical protein